MEEKLEVLNEWFASWDINGSIDYTQAHIGCIEEYDEEKYAIYIEKYDDYSEDYIYSNYKELIDKKEIEEDINRTIYYCNNDLEVEENEYYELYEKIDFMINWYESEKGFEYKKLESEDE